MVPSGRMSEMVVPAGTSSPAWAPHHGLGWNLREQRPENLVLNQLPPACVIKNSHSSASGTDSCR